MRHYDLTAGTVAAPTSFLNTADVTTVDNSNKVLVQIDAALQQIATSGAQLGAYQNRFTAAISGLNTDATNLSSARSSIEDTDYAQATSICPRRRFCSRPARRWWRRPIRFRRTY